MKEACSHFDDEVHTEECHDLCLCDKGFKARHYSAKEKTLCQYYINFFWLKNVDKTEFCNFHHPLPWEQSKMATKQNKFFEVCMKGIVCLMKMVAEIDTDTYYVHFVRRILNYVAFCIFNELSFNIMHK